VSSRRRFLGLAGASLAIPFVSACGGSGGSTAGAAPASSGTSTTISATTAATASSSSSSSTSSSAASSASTATSSVPTTGYVPTAAWTKGAGPALDTTGLIKTFDSTFASASDLSKITVAGGGGPWYAPVHADYGSAHFASPLDAVNPFAIVDGKLRIRCEQVNGKWQTGHMQTCDFAGSGFSQQRGYFEIRAKMPPAGTMGAWPAFWLYSKANYTDTTKVRAELDVIEYYPGADSRGHHSAVHLRPATGKTLTASDLLSEWWTSCYNGLDALKDGDWHTYGVEITAKWIIIYLDRVELKRIPTLPEFDVPMYMLVSNALLTEETAKAVGPIDFWIDYVRVWQRI